MSRRVQIMDSMIACFAPVIKLGDDGYTMKRA
jgi:hypothetical protein